MDGLPVAVVRVPRRSGRVLVPREFPVKGAAVDTQHLRRLRLVTADECKHPQDVAFLEVLERHDFCWVVCDDDKLFGAVVPDFVRQILHRELVEAGQSDSAFQAILQLPDISGPSVGHQFLCGGGGQNERLLPSPLGEALEKVLGNLENVAAAVA